jgi:hypothetical protein
MQKNEIGRACTNYGEEERCIHSFGGENYDPGIGGRIILKCIFEKWDVEAWTGSMWLRIGTGGGHF